MINFILHRANEFEKAVLPLGFNGAEIDLRLHYGKLVLAHDPFMDGISLDEWLKSFTGDIVILNPKETGLEQKIVSVISSIAPKVDYFFLDLPIPSLVKLINTEIPVAVRVSELEPFLFSSKVSSSWIWADSFFGDWSHLEEISSLGSNLGKKICLVSPELQGRWPDSHKEEFDWLKSLVHKNPSIVQAICTKNRGFWVD